MRKSKTWVTFEEARRRRQAKEFETEGTKFLAEYGFRSNGQPKRGQLTTDAEPATLLEAFMKL